MSDWQNIPKRVIAGAPPGGVLVPLRSNDPEARLAAKRPPKFTEDKHDAR